MTTDDEFSQEFVDDGVAIIFDDTQDVESRQDGFGQLDVLREGCPREA
jgi:hypothetical protein